MATDAGTATGTRVCRGGRAPVRKAMDQAALTCVTHAQVVRTVDRAQYREMAARKGATRSLVAIARRMLVLVTAGADAYLETDEAANIRFYEKFSCAVVAEEQVLDVPCWYMLRSADSAD